MKNHNYKSKPRSVFRAALWGGLLFAGFSAVVMVVCYFCGSKGDLLGPEALIGIPAGIILYGLHLNGPNDWISNLHSIPLIYLICGMEFSVVNGLLGALLFAVVARFRRFIVKKSNYENQTTGIE